MVRIVRRRSLHRPTYPDRKRGKLDDAIWGLVVKLAVAARAGDRTGYLRAFRELASGYTLASQRLAGFYIKVLLRRQLDRTLGPAPSPAEIEVFAARIRPHFHLVLPNESHLLELLFAAAYERGEPDEAVRGGKFTYCGMAALGVLLEHPEQQLVEARPDLERWCAGGADIIRRMCESPEVFRHVDPPAEA
jgi:hypothetical protein